MQDLTYPPLLIVYQARLACGKSNLESNFEKTLLHLAHNVVIEFISFMKKDIWLYI